MKKDQQLQDETNLSWVLKHIRVYDTLDASSLKNYLQIKQFVKESNKKGRDLVSVEFSF